MPSYSASEQALIWARLCDAPPEHFINISKNILSQLDSGTFATTDLLILRHILDIECIRVQGSNRGASCLRDALLEPQVVVTAILCLSKRLIKHHNPDTPRTREWQLRALISAFALLNCHNATHISHAELSDIQRALGSMSQDAHWQQKLTNDSLSHGACLYLVRLATDYSKAFRSDQPLWITTTERILNFAFAAGAAYQTDALRAVEELNKAFQPIWRNQQQRYKALRSLCELTRTTRIIRYWALALGPEDPTKAKQLYNLALELAKLSIAETLEILDNDSNLEGQSPQNILQALGDNLNATMSRSSNLDASSFMYGLLDNAAQLAQLFPIQSLNLGFTKRLLLIIERSAVEQFQLKSMEIILISPQTRDRNFVELRHKIENEVVMKWIPDRKAANRTVLMKQLNTTRESLDAHDMATSNFWLSVSKLVPTSQIPVVADASPPNRLQRGLPEPDFFEQEDRSPQGRIIEVVSNASSSPSQGLRQSTMDIPGARWSSVSSTRRISSIPRHASTARTDYSRLSEVGGFLPFNTTLSEPPLLRQYSLARKLFRQKNYFASGISPDCCHVFFLEEALVDVFEIPPETWESTQKEPVLRLKAPRTELFRTASLGTSVLAVISGRSCRLYAINGAVIPQEICSPIQMSDWDPECVAFGALESRSIVAIGWRCGMAGTNETRGKLTVYEIPQQHISTQLQVLISISLPERDYPKFIGLSQDLGGLATISSTTQRLNIVSAWRLRLQPPCGDLMCSTARSFTAEAGVEGVTSTVVFTSPAGNPYILCTTSHSSERRKENHEGEFPFLVPAVTPFPKFGSGFFHPLTQFIHKLPLQVAAVPVHGSIVALLDRGGQIWLLPLELSEQGGLKSAETPKKMAVKLTADLSGKAASLSFSPDGRRLVAADNRGNLAMLVFEEQGLSVPASLANGVWTSPVELPSLKTSYEMDGNGIGFREMDGTGIRLGELDGSGVGLGVLL